MSIFFFSSVFFLVGLGTGLVLATDVAGFRAHKAKHDAMEVELGDQVLDWDNDNRVSTLADRRYEN